MIKVDIVSSSAGSIFYMYFQVDEGEATRNKMETQKEEKTKEAKLEINR